MPCQPPPEAVTASGGKERTVTCMPRWASIPGLSCTTQAIREQHPLRLLGPGSSLPHRAHSSVKKLTVNLTSQDCPSGDSLSRHPLVGPEVSIHCHLHRPGFAGPLTASSCMDDWKRSTPTDKGQEQKGPLGCSTLWRTHGIWMPPPKPVSLPVPSLGPVQAVVSPAVTGHLRTA